MTTVPRPGESADHLIRRHMKQLRNSGLMKELQDREGYDKPSVKRRRKQARARWNNREA